MSVAAHRPLNGARRSPTVTFSLPEEQVERLRQIAWARDVSVSQVMRDALDLAFACWTDEVEAPPAPEPEPPARAPTHWPRELRRRAARDGAGSMKPPPIALSSDGQ